MALHNEDPRRFNERQRRYLFREAHGLCQLCSAELDDDWEAHHVLPYAKGGRTEVGNGAALCAPCNKREGDRYVKVIVQRPVLRKWQQEFLNFVRRRMGSQSNFQLQAWPGSGKTIGVLAASLELSQRVDKPLIVILAPSTNVRDSWAKVALERFGLQLLCKRAVTTKSGNSHVAWKGGSRLFGPGGYAGVVLTYQQAATGDWAQEIANLCHEFDVVAILDEVHHVSSNKAYGDAVETAFARATYRVLLSGTPFRVDGGRISFAEYLPVDGKFQFRTDEPYGYGYGYRDALNDNTCRPVRFFPTGGPQTWKTPEGAVETADFETDVTVRQASYRLRTSLSPASDLVPNMIKEANAKLSEIRKSIPDAAAIVVAQDQEHARWIKRLVRELTGHEASLAISDGDDQGSTGSEVIKRFTEGDPRWIVAVGMISEGVDIPRLKVLVYASNVLSLLFFIQVLGRIIRVREGEPYTPSLMFIPNEQEKLVRYARMIENEIKAGLREQEEAETRDSNGDGDGEGDPRNSFLPLSGEGDSRGVVDRGDKFSEFEIRRAEFVSNDAGEDVDPVRMSRILRGAEKFMRASQGEPLEVIDLSAACAKQAALFRTVVGRIAFAYKDRGNDEKDSFAKAHTLVKTAIGIRGKLDTKNATLEELRRWIEVALKIERRITAREGV